MNDSQAVVTDVSKVVDKVMPSMVSVYNNFTQTRQDFFGQTYSQQSQATGSGIIIGKTDTELLIVTNNHVVADADSLQVQFQDENTADASIKGTDETNDLAVIAVKLSDIKDDTMSKISIATLGNSDNLVLGEPVVAIGNALGYGQSVTTGVVSALNREITQENNETGTFIQTDAAINPGNSGGALVDLNGNVIGINSSKIGGSTVEGMGYAIPISKAEPIIESLMNQTTKEKVSEDKQGYLGISGVSVTSQVSSAYNMPQGVYVAKVISGTGAADSDLKKGDIITAIEGSTVQSLEQLQKQLTYYEAGSTVTITVKRASANGEYKEQEIKIKLTDKKTMEAASESEDSQNKSSSPAAPGNGNGSQGNSDSGNGQNGNENNGSAGDDSGEEDDGENGFYQFPWSFFGN
ncbi:MAG TPA: serine protease [Lachnospiraceae bacterium]|nr:serine protease [Lachnospiraceae bacterium]